VAYKVTDLLNKVFFWPNARPNKHPTSRLPTNQPTTEASKPCQGLRLALHADKQIIRILEGPAEPHADQASIKQTACQPANEQSSSRDMPPNTKPSNDPSACQPSVNHQEIGMPTAGDIQYPHNTCDVIQS
jgi:hypothetical protein